MLSVTGIYRSVIYNTTINKDGRAIYAISAIAHCEKLAMIGDNPDEAIRKIRYLIDFLDIEDWKKIIMIQLSHMATAIEETELRKSANDNEEKG